MAVIMGQYTVPANSTVAIFSLPPGYYSATMYNLGAQAIYLSTTLAGANTNSGLQLHSVPTTIQGSMTSKGSTVFATTGNGTAGTINLFMVTDQ